MLPQAVTIIVILFLLCGNSYAAILPTQLPFAWNATEGWAAGKTLDTAVMLAGPSSILTVDSDAQWNQTSSTLDTSYSTAVEHAGYGFVYFVGGGPNVTKPILTYSGGEYIAASSLVTATTRYPAAAALNDSLFVGGGRWVSNGRNYTVWDLTWTTLLKGLPSNPVDCPAEQNFPLGFGSSAVSTAQHVMFTRGCISFPDYKTEAGYLTPCGSIGGDVMVLGTPLPSSPCSSQMYTFNLSPSRSRVGIAASSQYVVFAGGELINGTLFDKVDVYLVDAIQQNFTSPPIYSLQLTSARRNIKAIVLQDRYFFFIGGDTVAGPNSEVVVWDSTSTSSLSNAILPRAGTLWTAVSDPSNNMSILAIGGYGPGVDSSFPIRITIVPESTPLGTTTPPTIPSTTVAPTPSLMITTTVHISVSTTSPSSVSTTSLAPTSPSSTQTTSASFVPSSSPTTLNPTPISCLGEPPFSPAMCVDGKWIGTEVVIYQKELNISSPVIISGTLNITHPQVVIEVRPFANGDVPVTVHGVASLGGTLQLVLGNETKSGETIPILTAQNITRTFDGVRVLTENNKTCVAGKLKSSSTLVSVITVGCKKHSLTWLYPVIIVCAVVVAVGVAVLLHIRHKKGQLRLSKRKSEDTDDYALLSS